MTDTNQLLREYLRSGSESAFREIVSRYVDLVYSVAVRRMDGNHELARDAAQAVFTDLARKAPSLRPESSLGGWLHRHTCFICSTLLRTERRRLVREQIAVEMNHLNEPSEAAWQHLAPALDEAIDQLTEPDRQAIVLRFYERRDLRAVGAALGTNEDAAQKRLSRALEKLRGLLAGKGLSLSATALATILGARAVSAAPTGLASELTAAALSAAAAGGFWTSLITSMTSLKVGLGLGVAAAVLVTGAVLYQRHSTNGAISHAGAGAPLIATTTTAPSGTADPSGSASAVTPPGTEPGSSAVAQNADLLRITFLSADNGQAVPGVRVSYRGWEGDNFARKQFVSDDSGNCLVVVPRATITHLELTAMIDGFADTRLDWRTDRGEVIPPDYTVRLTRPVPIGGRIVDPDGAPIVGAKMGWNHQDDPAMETRPESHAFGWIEVESDSDGRWQINRIAPEMLRLLYGSPQHPDFIAPPLVMVSDNRGVEKELRDKTHVFHMSRALSLTGTVLNPDGQPVADANVRVGGLGESGSRQTKTLADGSFKVGGCKLGRNLVTAEAAGFTAATLEVDLATNTQPVRLTLQRGRTLHLLLVDTAGLPVAGANVWYDTMHSRRLDDATPPAVQVEFSPKTDAEGRAVWETAPPGDLFFSFAKTGYMRQDDVKVQADGQEHVVTLLPALVVFGTVVDASNGQPLPKFRIACGWPTPNSSGAIEPRFSNIDRFWLSFANGEFKQSFEEPLIGGVPENPGYMLKFEAEGFAPFLSRIIKADEGEVRLDVKLNKAVDQVVTLLLPDGTAAANFEVAFLGGNDQFRVTAGGFSRVNNQLSGGLLQTDDAGHFKLPPEDTIQQVAAAGAAGYGQAAATALRANPVMQLQAWGRIEGGFASGAGAAGRKVTLDSIGWGPGTIQLDFRSFEVQADSQGRFVFPQVPAGQWMISRPIPPTPGAGNATMHVPVQDVEVRPGETAQVTVAANARPVTAKLQFPSGLQRDPGTQIYAMIHTPMPKPPAEAQNNPEALRRWAESPEIVALRPKVRSYQLSEGNDGSWSADEIPAGEYVLTVNVMSSSSPGMPGKAIANAEVPVTIPAGALTDTFDAGGISLQLVAQ